MPMMTNIKYAMMYFMTVLSVIIIDRNVPRESQHISVAATKNLKLARGFLTAKDAKYAKRGFGI
jgi:hypothetical protein